MYRAFTLNLSGKETHSTEEKTHELALAYKAKQEAKKRPLGRYFNARDLLKSSATPYDLTLVTEEYEKVDEITGESETWIKTKKDYEVVITDVTEEHEAEQILISRQKEYGSIGEQLDEIFHDVDAWKARIQAVKDKYPKK